MSIGIIANIFAVVAGGICGTLAGKHLPEKLKQVLPMSFSLAAMAMGINAITKMHSMPAVILSLILGTVIGSLCGVERRIRVVGEKAAALFVKGLHTGESEKKRYLELFSIAVILFCGSATGIYGALESAMSGNDSILLSKSFLDLFTAAIFAATLGMAVAALAIPMLAIYLVLYLSAGLVVPLASPAMFADFSSCGGLLILATGFRMAEIKIFHVADMTPALLLVMPVSYAWSLLPL